MLRLRLDSGPSLPIMDRVRAYAGSCHETPEQFLQRELTADLVGKYEAGLSGDAARRHRWSDEDMAGLTQSAAYVRVDRHQLAELRRTVADAARTVEGQVGDLERRSYADPRIRPHLDGRQMVERLHNPKLQAAVVASMVLHPLIGGNLASGLWVTHKLRLDPEDRLLQMVSMNGRLVSCETEADRLKREHGY